MSIALFGPESHRVTVFVYLCVCMETVIHEIGLVSRARPSKIERARVNGVVTTPGSWRDQSDAGLLYNVTLAYKVM